MPLYTKHSKKRIKQRMKGGGEFEEALNLGIHYRHAKGQLKRWFRKINKDPENTAVVAYKNYVYIYDKSKYLLITVYPLPHNLIKYVK